MKLQDQKIVIPCVTTYEFIQLKDVIRFEGAYNSCKVYMTNGKVLTSTLKIGDYKGILKDCNFFCCHKSHLINVMHIERYNKESFVEMVDGCRAPVSRRNREKFFSEIIQSYHICEVALRTETKKSLLPPELNNNEVLLNRSYDYNKATSEVVNEVTT